MTTVTTKATVKVAAVATGLAMAVSMFSFAPMAQAALTSTQVSAIIALLTSFGADASTIANVQASLTGGTPSAPSSTAFTRDLTVGSKGADVTALQDALKAGGYMSASATGYFGALTKAGVIAWQTAKGVTPAAGYFGPKSRAAFGGVSTTPTTPGTPVAPITGNGLKVSLATDSPNNIALVQGQAIGSLAKFTFANPTATDIKVTNLGFKRIGVSNDSTLTNVYIYSGTKRLTDSAGVSNTAFSFNDPTGLFTVSAGMTYTVSVLADIAGSTSGQQVGVQLTAVTSSGTLDSSVSFPVNGYTQTVSAATLATADFNTTTNPTVTTIAAQNDYTVWSNSTTISTRAVNFESFQLRNIGSVDRAAINNFRLYVKGVQVGTAVAAIASDDTVTFDLSATPVKIETGTAEIKVVGNIIAGSGNTFQFSLRRASDARFVDTDLNQPILATANGSTFTARSAISATVDSGTVSTVKAAASQSSNVSLSATSVKWATFELRAAGEDVKVESLDVQANTSLDRGLDNGKVFLNGVQVGSTKDLTDATDVNFTFGSSMILKAGTTAIVDIYADAKSTTGATFVTGETAAITLGTGSSNAQGQKSLAAINTPTGEVTANTVTISSSTLTLAKYSGYSDTSMIAGTNSAKLGSFTLSTGSTEGVNISTLTVALSADEAATITDLMLKDNATGAQIGSTKSAPSTSNAFSVNVSMGASATKVVDIYGNIKSGSNPGTWIANIDATGTGSVTGSTVDADALNLQTITLRSGVLTTATGVSPDNMNVIAGTSVVKVGSFDFTAQYSAYTVDEIKVKVPANSATAVSSITLKYPDVNGATQSSTQSIVGSSGSQAHATSTFAGLTFYIPAGTTKKIDAYVNLSTIQNDGDSGKAITVVLDNDDGFHATDSAGTATTTMSGGDLTSSDTSGKGTLYVRKSIPTISGIALDSPTLTQGANIPLARVKVTADAAGDISWDLLVFTMTKTSTVVFGATTTASLWSGGSQISGNFATTTATSSTAVTQTVDMWGVSSTGGTLTFLPVSEQSISAGGSATYELRGTISLPVTTGGYSVNTSVANAQTSASSTATAAQVGSTFINGRTTAPSFIWSDKSAIASVHSLTTSDWTDDYLIKSLPVTVGNLAVTQ